MRTLFDCWHLQFSDKVETYKNQCWLAATVCGFDVAQIIRFFVRCKSDAFDNHYLKCSDTAKQKHTHTYIPSIPYDRIESTEHQQHLRGRKNPPEWA